MTVPEIHGVEIEGKIGQGGVATVWKGRQLTLDRPVAVKVLQAQWGDDPADVQRFQAEARSAAKLKHASIIQVHDANFAEGQYYIVMEFIDGYTVGDWLRRKGQLLQKDALLIAECVADGLAYAWQNARIIHCDIKPDNVMVDRDGTVKIADLGLARTIDVLRPSAQTDDEIMGTPAYMSPEQARGLSDLDCRADIYSLGCMLYHILTGKIPFEGKGVDAVLDLQASGQLPDVMDVVSGVSKPMCALLQKMMAKDRALRQADWHEVLRDIQAVRHGRLPSRLPPPEASTMACSKRRIGAENREDVRLEKPAYISKKTASLALAVILFGLGLAGLLRLVLRSDPKPDAPAVLISDLQEEPIDVVEVESVGETEAHERYQAARAWQHDNPKDITGAIRELRTVASAYPDTEYGARAREEIDRLESMRRHDIERAVASLRQQVAEHTDRGDYTGAVAVVEGYDGIWTEATATSRRDLVTAIRQQQVEHESALRAAEVLRQQRIGEVWDELCRALLDDGVVAAARTLARLQEKDTLDADTQGALHEMQVILAEVLELHHRVLDSFEQDRGRVVPVQLRSGMQELEIIDVDPATETVHAEQQFMIRGHQAARSMRFSIHDLAPEAYAERVGRAEDPAVVLAHVLETGSMADLHALGDKLVSFPKPFSEALLAALHQRRAAEQALAAAGALAEESQDSADPDEGEEMTRLRGTSTLLARAQLWQALVADADAHRDLDEPIWRAMVAVNPELFAEDVRIMREPETGRAVRVEIVSRVLSEIGPLAALAGIEALVCAGVNPRHSWRNIPVAPLRDLTPLRGFPLVVLHINNTSVRDLSPLQDMPLAEFNASHTQVSDITPLRNAPLEVVQLRGTSVRDISVLRGKPLKKLDVSNTAVFDFRPVSGTMLSHFEAAGSQLRDLGVLHGSPIRYLNISDTGVFSFTALRDLPLEHLELDKTQIRDLAVLRGKSLRHLSLRETRVTDIAVLAGMPLHNLYLSKTPIGDFSVLASLPLQDLDLSHTRIVDLAPLAQLPLRVLNLAHTRVRDLSPLEGAQIQTLNIRNVPLESLAPLASMPIERLTIDNPARSQVQRVLRRMPSLRFVNGEEWIR